MKFSSNFDDANRICPEKRSLELEEFFPCATVNLCKCQAWKYMSCIAAGNLLYTAESVDSTGHENPHPFSAVALQII